VFLRGLSGKGKIYYYQLKDPATGKYQAAKSTRATSKPEAEKFAKRQARDRTRESKDAYQVNQNTKVTDFIFTYWDDETSPFIQKRRQHNPNALQSGYTAAMGSYYGRYVAPIVGNLRLGEITPSTLESVQSKVRKRFPDLTPQTVNDIVRSLTQPLRTAAKSWIIPKDPTTSVERYAPVRRKTGVFTELEVSALRRITWNDEPAQWAFLTGIFTGLRKGEILALCQQDLICTGDQDTPITVIQLDHSWSKTHGLKCPKNGTSRVVPIPAILSDRLKELAKENPHGDGLIFWSDTANQPFSDKRLDRALATSLCRVGVAREAQKLRNLRWHSTRHYFNSVFVGKINNEALRKVIGHSSPKLTETYFHASAKDLVEVLEVQTSAFEEINRTREENL
jgi:integrase